MFSETFWIFLKKRQRKRKRGVHRYPAENEMEHEA